MIKAFDLTQEPLATMPQNYKGAASVGSWGGGGGGKKFSGVPLGLRPPGNPENFDDEDNCFAFGIVKDATRCARAFYSFLLKDGIAGQTTHTTMDFKEGFVQKK